MSEHMNALGVPTTRALALIDTTRDVYREDGPRESKCYLVCVLSS